MDIEERAIQIAQYIVENNVTVRAAARKFGVGKTTVHDDVTKRLPEFHPLLAAQAREVLDVNKGDRHNRGGEATKKKYEQTAA